MLAEFPKGLQIIRNYDTSLPDLLGDREQLIQAVLNIAHNAAQALSEEIRLGVAQIEFKTRVARSVTISKQRYKLAMDLHVVDNGPGIPLEFRSRIFGKFAQADSSDTRAKGGTGLGLSITKKLTEQMNGKIGFDSVVGEGATFYIILPIFHQQLSTLTPTT